MLWITPQLHRYGGLCALIPLGDEDFHAGEQPSYSITRFLGEACGENCCRRTRIGILLLTKCYLCKERDSCAGGRHSIRYHA